MTHFAGHFQDVADGGVCSGVLYRTGWTLVALCPSGRSPTELFGNHIDLRSDAEAASLRLGHPATRIPIDLPGAALRIRAAATGERELAEVYRDTLRHCGSAFADVAAMVAERVPEPTVIGCSLGKDRTGLAVALILTSVGFPLDSVVERDMRARAAIPACRHGLSAYARAHNTTRVELTQRCRTGGRALHHALTDIGAPDTFLLDHGLTRGHLTTLRTALAPRW
ncbi:tyrosine-protein phosphatase [Nocardia sp. SC052]|uniref:tyrosine-protein phosphatase n=1 Tax=Nocardia sichangensis TaxID=3385975 RepID=UPI0039A12776